MIVARRWETIMKKRYLLAALLAVAPFAQANAAPAYKLVKTIALGAPDRWDYVVYDNFSDRAYVAHGDALTVVDVNAGKVAGTLAVGGVTHGFAAVPSLGKGYTDDGKSGMAVGFDLKTLKELKRIKVEPDADGIVYDAANNHVLVITGDSGKVSVIDPKTDSVVATIDGGGPLEFGVLGGNGKFYVDGEDKNEIVRMDLASNSADAHWPLAGCKTPHGLAIDRAHMVLFASCGNKVMDVVNAKDGTVLASLPIDEGTDFAQFDPARGLAFSSNRAGTLSIIAKQDGKYVALPPVVTMRGARTMSLDPKTGRLYLVASDVTVNDAVPAGDRARYKVTPGTAKLLVLDPVR
jgi:YVTN family beta-propeller protein